MDPLQSLFYVCVLIMSVVAHEVAHGFAAYFMGDMTALHQGRLTFNPLKHLDPLGSVILPLLLVISGAGFVIGWAKPVPYNPLNLRNYRWGTILVASAGIITNLFLALIFGLFMRFAPNLGITSPGVYTISATIVIVNCVLALFNLMPIPPLDGSKILFALLPNSFRRYEYLLEKYGFVLVLIFVFFGWKLITPLVFKMFTFFSGAVL